MLRQEILRQTSIGLRAKRIMEEGELVSDGIVLEMVRKKVRHETGFLLDGFPRTLSQAHALEQMNIAVNHVIDIVVDDAVIIRRLGMRRVHPSSGRVYHLEAKPPKQAGADDETGEPLVQRSDDAEEIVVERLRVYHEQTQPLSAYYIERAAQKILHYDEVVGDADTGSVFSRIRTALDATHC